MSYLPSIILSTILCVTTTTSVTYETSQFTLAACYEDHMVLQRAPFQATIWGYASKVGDNVTVFIGNKMVASANVRMNVFDVFGGFWLAKLPPISDDGPFNITVTSSEGILRLRDVLFGDVWICSGQDNMAFTLDQVFNASAEIEDAMKFQHVRMFTVKRRPFEYPMYNIRAQQSWTSPSKGTIGNFSALCWLYGKYLNEDLGYPIGLIDASYEGSNLANWVDPETAADCGTHSNTRSINAVPSSSLWNGMVHPFANMTIYGAILYHGESDTTHTDNFRCLLTSMIFQWRMQFYEASDSSTDNFFPIGTVQLAPGKNDSNITTGFPDIRWHQTANIGYTPNTLLEKVFLAVTMDLPDFTSPWGSTRPRDKQDIARRLVLSSRSVAYGQDVGQFRGPYPSSLSLNTAEAYVQINYDYNSTLIDLRSTKGFELCCSSSDRSFCNGTDSSWVTAPIIKYSDHYVLISYKNRCTDTFIMGIRYAWRESPCDFKACAVYSRDNSLPAPPYILMRNLASS